MSRPRLARQAHLPAPVRIDALAASYRRLLRRQTVLEDVELEVEPGEVAALVGPNGAGKTTLLRILLGFKQPDRGRCAIADLSPRLPGPAPSGDPLADLAALEDELLRGAR